MKAKYMLQQKSLSYHAPCFVFDVQQIVTECNAYSCDMHTHTQLLKLIEAAQLSLVGDCIEVCRSPMLMQVGTKVYDEQTALD